MDWNHVTFAEVFHALKEVEWRQPPQPLFEFFQPLRFTLPKTQKKWRARVKNNLWYYRVNYAAIIFLSLAFSVIRRPRALMAVLVCTLALLCLNVPFAASLSDRILRLLRLLNVRLAQKIRASTGGQGGPGYPDGRSTKVKVCGVPRRWVAGALGLAGALSVQRTHALLVLSAALLVGAGLTAVHATFRSPNLKCRLGSAQDEFRTLWRGMQQQDAEGIIDYTL